MGSVPGTTRATIGLSLPAVAEERAGRWKVGHITASAQAIHAASIPAEPVPELWIIDVARPALVVGSSQRRLVEPLRAWVAGHGVDLDVVARNSGGGAVFVAPGEQVWIDVFVPKGDQQWSDDVRSSVDWLGTVWRDAVAAALPDSDVTVHCGGLDRTEWATLVCFGGVGPGEVFVDGRKAVGISQRRSRDVARFQCMALLQWRPWAFAPLGEVAGIELPGPISELEAKATALPVGADELVGSVLQALATR